MPKRGNTLAEYEDAFAGNPERGRFAIADGASESSFASSWAKILVNSFVHKAGPWSGWLPAARKRWRSGLDGRELPWYAETKFEEGAYAALLGVHFDRNGWRAEAVGDSCLFQVRDNGLRRAFPVCRARDFSNQPNLLGSRPPGKSGPRTRRMRLGSDWQAHDVLFLMTDALAQWFLTKTEERQEPWQELLPIETTRDFVECVERFRDDGMRNDDVTLIRIRAQNAA